jgi:peptidoglycan/xylan/chitin deacetylase (PgdA/CDA1 family)
MKFRGLGRLRKFCSRIGFQLSNRAVVLLYHRIADLASDPQLLAVSPSNFKSHLEVIRNKFQPLSLGDLTAAIQSGKVPHRGVTVTFDDGYFDNLLTAKPLLQRYKVPGTVFVSSGAASNSDVFWWDELERLLFGQPNLPASLCLNIQGRSLKWELGNNHRHKYNSHDHHLWSVLSDRDPTPAHSAYRDLCERVRPLDTAEREAILISIREQTGGNRPPTSESRAMTSLELNDLVQGDRVEVGAHTISHVQLSAVSKSRQAEEIKHSKRTLHDTVGRPIISFSYPFGGRHDYTQDTINIVKEEGFACACSNFEGVVTGATDPFQIPRFVVRNWDRREFAAKLNDWFTRPRQ